MRECIQPGFPSPLNSPACVPAQNVRRLWLDQATRRQLHDTVADAARTQATLAECGLGHDGLGIFLMPSRIEHPRGDHADYLPAQRDRRSKTYRISKGQ
ncbi:MAG: hypothetical protein LBU75_12125 [Desulfovibrio sp.]|jgi:hypothetical protein|nr:hypothetical protein [Desulfovibrio sp.]